MFNFQTSDGLKIAYDVDDLTDPWKTSDTLVVLHSAMASAAALSSKILWALMLDVSMRAGTPREAASMGQLKSRVWSLQCSAQ